MDSFFPLTTVYCSLFIKYDDENNFKATPLTPYFSTLEEKLCDLQCQTPLPDPKTPLPDPNPDPKILSKTKLIWFQDIVFCQKIM